MLNECSETNSAIVHLAIWHGRELHGTYDLVVACRAAADATDMLASCKAAAADLEARLHAAQASAEAAQQDSELHRQQVCVA